MRVLGRVQHPCGKCVYSSEGVTECVAAVGGELEGDGVGGEVSADEVAVEGISEGDGGVAGVAVVEVGAEGCDFDGLVVEGGADCAVFDAGVPDGVGEGGQDGVDGFGACVCGEVEVVAGYT